MSDDLWARDEPESPCVKVCVMHPTEGLCIGCLRSLAEIAAWSQMSVGTRRAVLAELPSRAPRLGQRRGGRASRARAVDAPK